MIYQLVIPEMGGVEELRVLQWHKAEGDALGEGQLLLELETDKAVVEVRSPRACVLRRIAVAEGGWARVGPAVAVLADSPDEEIDVPAPSDFMPRWEII